MENDPFKKLRKRGAQFPAPTPPTADEIKAFRREIGVGARVMAQLLNSSIRTVLAWEAGDRVPDPTSTKLLRVAMKNPRILLEI